MDDGLVRCDQLGPGGNSFAEIVRDNNRKEEEDYLKELKKK